MGDESSGLVLSAAVDASGALVVLDEINRTAPLRRKPPTRTNRLLALAILLVLAAAILLAVWQDRGGIGKLLDQGPDEAVRTRLEPAPPVDAVLYDTRNLPIAPESAIDINAKRPPDIRNVLPASAFMIGSAPADALPRQTALQCLAQAIYYEAASESDEGQRAVAQVVLNRVRSPAFPNTVCGVVYQGWTRTTGCQFSFACDGSMQRAPTVSGIARARRIAGEALGGAVMREVGNATHYHADYVVPYWAGSLDKVQTVGRHIFYLIRGGLGRPGAFTARYLSALERSPFAALETTGIGEPEAGLASQSDALSGGVPPADPLAADLAMGRLIASDGSVLIAAPAGLVPESADEDKPNAGSALKADARGRIDGGARAGRLIADERRAALRDDDGPPDAPAGN